MMKPIRPHIAKGATYPPEFRVDAVRYWLSSGQTLAAVSTDLGLSPECLRSWRKQMEVAQWEATTPPTPEVNGDATSTDLALAREIGQLRRELEAMTRQRDILKKAISAAHSWAPGSEDKAMNGGLK